MELRKNRIYPFIIFSTIILGCILVVYLLTTGSFNNPKTFKVELVQALVRHGDRIPDKQEVYKTDPYDPDYYITLNYGQLTKIGIEREFEIGQLLKERYGTFIGEYNADYVYGYSTDFNRTRASLQMVLAGIFSPSTEQSIWEKISSWTPVEIHSRPFDSDFILGPILDSCTNYSGLLKEVERLPEIQKQVDKYEKTYNFIRNKTGIGSSRSFTAIFIACNFSAIQRMGLELPSWVTDEVFNMLVNISALFWDVMAYTAELRKITVGPMVKKFLGNMKNHDRGDKRRIYLYSAHDLTIAPFTRAHNITGLPVNPGFGSTLILEKLRGSDGEAYVRMFMWTGTGKELIKLKLENCDYECPLEEYEKRVAPLLPDFDFDTCFSENLQCNTVAPSAKVRREFILAYQTIDNDVFTFKYGNDVFVQR